MTQNYFDFFGLETQFNIEITALEAKFRTIQAQVHPDKFVTASSADQHKAMQTATLANDAYQTLKSPARRAVYLLSLKGINAVSETNTTMPMDFLMQQMEWREQLDEAKQARNVYALEVLAGVIKTEAKQLQAHFADNFDLKNDYASATDIARKLTFMDKVNADIRHAIELLD
ncbi:MAG: Fe-S protein assembly co-chaperone HscB [Methylophilaceae bacterium]